MTRNARRPSRFDGHEYPQRIPEPDHIVAGAPAPWISVDDAQRRDITLAGVIGRLRSAGRLFEVAPLPGDPTEMAAVADAKRQTITRRSAVLVALFEEDGETHVILTRRSLELRSHRGEIALPGGRIDEGETPVEAAVREAYEEVGLDPDVVEAVGWLSPIVTFASGSAIWPVVGRLRGRPVLTADSVEVDRVFTASLSELLADGAFVEERWRRFERRPGADAEGYFPIYFFRVPGDLIWGATARVLTELLCVVTGVEWPDAHRVWG
jgi:8-oxo-dGTP pyrophosphatase MutT (NUDIX family)